MTLQLINASLIWLSSLLVFEVFLKRETFHRWNRFFLIISFCAGMALPFLPWGYKLVLNHINTNTSNSVPEITQSAQASAVPAAVAPPPGQNWWLLIYLCGVCLALILLVRDIVKLIRLYRHAVKERDGKWIIAETGMLHSPFSFLHIIFVNNRDQYTETEWYMVLQHEQQHHKSRHIFDLVLLQAGTILFWFHPLVYVYRRLLRLLHEYEVDSMQETDTEEYGRFLLEQSLLKPAPAIAHSFNCSPLKNRIYMMTRIPSKRSAQYRLLLLLPLLAAFTFCCAKNRKEIDIEVKNGQLVKKGTDITYAKAAPPDTVYVEDMITKERKMLIANMAPKPEQLDGQTIIPASELTEVPTGSAGKTPLTMTYIIAQSGIGPVLAQIEDGKYGIGVRDILVNRSGQAVAYSFEIYNRDLPVSAKIREEASLKLSAILFSDDFTFTIGKNKTGNPVPYQFPYSSDMFIQIIVKDHKVSYEK